MDTFRTNFEVNFEASHEAMLLHWNWFREHINNRYGVESLPNSFSTDEGEITEHIPVDEDDILFDLTPPEYNYPWKTQSLKFKEENHLIKIRINIEYSRLKHYTFSYDQGYPESKIEILISQFTSYIGLHKNSKDVDYWKGAIGNF